MIQPIKINRISFEEAVCLYREGRKVGFTVSLGENVKGIEFHIMGTEMLNISFDDLINSNWFVYEEEEVTK